MPRRAAKNIASAVTVAVLFLAAIFVLKTVSAESPRPRANDCPVSGLGDLR